MKTIRFLDWELPLLQQGDPADAGQHIGERSLEVPIGAAWARQIGFERLVEVGAVLPYHAQLPDVGPIRHRVVDPYDPWDQCDRSDAEAVDYTGWDVLSISTVEHIGLREYGNPVLDPDKGWRVVEKITREAGRYLITFPLGYNLQLDARVAASPLRRRFFVQTTPFNTWAPAPTEDWSHAYGRPYPWANAVCILHRE